MLDIKQKTEEYSKPESCSEDIILLADYFLEKYNQQHGQKKKFSPDAKKALMAYDWPKHGV